MSPSPQISDAEWEVMKVVWDHHPQPVTAAEIIDRLARERDWSPRTIKTMLNRLVGKGAVDFRPEGKKYLYRAKVTRDACVRRESRSFLSRVFDGAAAPAVLHLLSQCEADDFRKLPAQEIERLRQLLEEAGEGGGGQGGAGER